MRDTTQPRNTVVPPTIGRVVHYRLPERPGDTRERWRPAHVVNGPFPEGRVNLTVMLDGLNDARDAEEVELLNSAGVLYTHALLSVGSADEGEAPGCWRWPPRV